MGTFFGVPHDNKDSSISESIFGFSNFSKLPHNQKIRQAAGRAEEQYTKT